MENKELLVPMTVKKKRKKKDACKAKTSRRRCIAEDEKCSMNKHSDLLDVISV